MKRTKLQQSNPITLSSKRHQQDKYSTPNKAEWANPLQSTDSNNNKSFFTHMKAQLSNIKNDFQRLIQRQEKPLIGSKQFEGKNGLQTAVKGKSFSSYKPEDRPILFDKYANFQADLSSRNKEGGDKPLGLWKNISEAVNFKNKHVALKQKETSLVKKVVINKKEEQEKQFGFINLTPRMVDAELKSKQLLQQSQAQKHLITKYQQQITIYKEENAKSKYQIIKLSQQNAILKERVNSLENQVLSTNNSLQQEIIAKVTSLQTEVASKTTSLQTLQAEIVEKVDQIRNANQDIETYRSKIKQLQENIQLMQQTQIKTVQIQPNSQILKEKQEIQKQRLYYNQKINELSFYNSNFYNDNVHLTQENHHLKQTINQLTQQNQQIQQRFTEQSPSIRQALAIADAQNQHLKALIGHLQNIIEDCKRMNVQAQREHQRKLQYLQKNINEYEKRQLMFQNQIQKLYQQIHSNIPIDQQSNQLQLHKEIDYLRIELTKQQQINQAITNKYKEQIDKLNIQQVTRHLQSTIHSLTDQKHGLKNQLNLANSKLQELDQKCKSYSQQIVLYQQREKEMGANRSLSCTQWEQMTDKIEQLLTQNKRLTEERDYKELLQQVNVQGNYYPEQQDNLLRVTKDQLQQISQLRLQQQALKTQLHQYQQQVALLKRKITKLQDQVKIFSPHQQAAVASLLAKYDHIHNELQSKLATISSLKNLIRQMVHNKNEHQDYGTWQQIDNL